MRNLVVYVEDSDSIETVAKIFINRSDDGTVEYTIFEDRKESDGTIFNNEDDDLELVEKILHGRNLHRQNTA